MYDLKYVDIIFLKQIFTVETKKNRYNNKKKQITFTIYIYSYCGFKFVTHSYDFYVEEEVLPVAVK